MSLLRLTHLFFPFQVRAAVTVDRLIPVADEEG